MPWDDAAGWDLISGPDELAWRIVRCHSCGEEVRYRSSVDMTYEQRAAAASDDRLATFEENGWPIEFVVIVHDPRDPFDWETFGPYDGPEAIRQAEMWHAEHADSNLDIEVHIAFHSGRHGEPPA